MLDPIVPTTRLAGPRNFVVLVLFVAGVDVNCDHGEFERSPATENIKHLHQCPAVLSTGQSDHDTVALFDQVEGGDRPSYLAGQLRAVGHKVCRGSRVVDG